MNIGEILERYARAAAAHGKATNCSDYRAANRAHDQVIRELKRLRRLKKEEALLELLDDRDPHVRCWAATHLLPLKEGAAIRELEALAATRGFVALDARMVLQEWRAGNLKLTYGEKQAR